MPKDKAVPCARRRWRPRRSTRPSGSSTTWMVLLAGILIPENRRVRRSRILRAPQLVYSRLMFRMWFSTWKGVYWHTDRGVGFGPSAIEHRTPGSDRRSCNLSCEKCRTPCRVPPSARRLACEHKLKSFIHHQTLPPRPPLPPKKEKSVTHVSGTICYICLGSLSHQNLKSLHEHAEYI